MEDNTPSANINYKGKIIHHVPTEVFTSNIELEIEAGDANHTRYQFRLVNGQVVIKKITEAKGQEKFIKQISSGADNIIIIQ